MDGSLGVVSVLANFVVQFLCAIGSQDGRLSFGKFWQSAGSSFRFDYSRLGAAWDASVRHDSSKSFVDLILHKTPVRLSIHSGRMPPDVGHSLTSEPLVRRCLVVLGSDLGLLIVLVNQRVVAWRRLIHIVKLHVFTGLELPNLLSIRVLIVHLLTALMGHGILVLLLTTTAAASTLRGVVLISPAVGTDVYLVLLIDRVQFAHGRREITV